MGDKKKKKMKPLGWLIMLIGLAGMIAFILVYWLKMDIAFLNFMFEPGEVVDGKATIVPKQMITFIVGGAGILLFIIGFLTKSKTVKK